MDKFHRIEKNPYVVGNPIKDSKMFFGREVDFLRIQDSINASGAHVIQLIAERRSGKTSLLFEIYRGRLKNIAEAVFMDFHAITPKIQSDEDLPLEIGKAILQNLEFKEFAEDFYSTQHTPTVQLLFLVDRCLEKIYPRNLLILCDEFEAIEEAFKTELLSSRAMSWARPILNKAVFFITTGSHQFENTILREELNHLSQPINIDALDNKDALRLINEPVANQLKYTDDVTWKILRLSGNRPFYIQYICQTLVNQNNAIYKHYQISIEDLEDTISFILKNPNGHMYESWKDPVGQRLKGKEKYWYICKAQHFLASLARTLRDAEEYLDILEIVDTAKKDEFSIEKESAYSVTAWLKINTSFLEIHEHEDKYRFQVDLLRRWIAFEFRRGDHVDAYNGKPCPANIEDSNSFVEANNLNIENNPYFSKLKDILTTEKQITLISRQTLDKIAKELGLSHEQQISIENNLRSKISIESLNWVEEYKINAQLLKRQYGSNIPKNIILTLSNIYENSDRINQEKAKEVRQYLELESKSHFKKIAIIGVGIAALIIGILYFVFLETENTLLQVVKPLPDITQTQEAPSITFLLSNYFQGDDLSYQIVAQPETTAAYLTTDNDDNPQLVIDTNTLAVSSVSFTVRATNSQGQSVEDRFLVTIESPEVPIQVVKPLPDITQTQNAPSVTFLLSNYFQGDDLSYQIVAQPETTAAYLTTDNDDNPQLVIDTNTLAVSSVSFTVRATNSQGQSVEDRFLVTIESPEVPKHEPEPQNNRFIKLNSNGDKVQAQKWSCVHDTETDLIWEVKVLYGARDYRKRYEWSPGWNVLLQEANEIKLCGYNTWRIPTIDELSQLHANEQNWTSEKTATGKIYIAPEFFPNVSQLETPIYWSSTPLYRKRYQAKALDFSQPVKELDKNKDEPAYIILVTSK